jgi:hypothetical protein
MTMGLRCLLGHDFTPPEVERERQEDGEEVVVTVREVKTCRRCGERQVVSENKEVTAVRTPDEVGLDDPTTPADRSGGDGGDVAADADGAGETGGEPATVPAGGAADAPDGEFEAPDDPGEEDAEILDGDDDERGHGEWPDAPEGRSTEDGVALADAVESAEAGEGFAGDVAGPSETTDAGAAVPDAGTDGAEIVDGDDDAATSAGGGGGATPWPDPESTDDDRGSAPAAWPEVEGDDEGYAAGPADGEDGPDVDFGGGLAPEASGDGARASYVGHDRDDVGGDPGSDIVRAETTGPAAGSSAPTEFYCPNCGHAESAGTSSMRSGDICPECRKGYIAERES